MNFMRRLNRENYYLLRNNFEIGGWKLATNTKLQLNISKIMQSRQKKTQEHGG